MTSRKTLHLAPSEAPEDKALIRRFLTVHEFKALRDLADRHPRDSALIRLIYNGALRREEPGMLILDYAKDMHKTGRIYIHRGKGSNSGYIDLTIGTQRALLSWITLAYKGTTRRPVDFIFPGSKRKGRRKKKGISGRAVYNIYNRLTTKLNLDHHLRHPHVLKRTRAQHMIEAIVASGRHPYHALSAVANLIGHANAKTTIEHYIAQSNEERELASDITHEILDD